MVGQAGLAAAGADGHLGLDGTVKIAAAGETEIQSLGDFPIEFHRATAVRQVVGFDAAQSVRFELAQKVGQLGGILDFQGEGVSQDRDTAESPNQLDPLGRGEHFLGHIGRSVLAQVPVERFLDRSDVPGLHHCGGDVGPAHVAVVDLRPDRLKVQLDAQFGQLADDLGIAPPPVLTQPLQLLVQGRIEMIHIVTQDVQLAPGIGDGQLHAGDHFEPSGVPFGQSFGVAVHRVMVRDGDGPEVGVQRVMDKLGGCERAVREGRVQV